MTRKEYLTELFKIYHLASKLSDKNDCEVLKVKNKLSNKFMIVRSFNTRITAYEELYKLVCQNLPIIYDVINLEDGQVVLEEYIEGLTVAEVMESGRYTYSGAKKVVAAVCNALSVLHTLGFVHRDVKPENVMIDKNGTVKLIDFNAARKISDNNKDTVIMGTVGYASPEQWGVSQSDQRSDIYAVGVMLNVMITGVHPSKKMATGKAGYIIKKCTNLNVKKRYQSAMQLYRALCFA